MTTGRKTGRTSRTAAAPARRGASRLLRKPEQAPLFTGSRQHVLDLDDFTREEVDHILRNADGMNEVLARDIRKTPALRGKTIITLFYEESTRTRVSFEQAGKILGADVINISVSTSSVGKGESLVNTLRTIGAMSIDALVIRHPHSGASYLATRHLNASVINAGDGMHAHPTQALLDLYTIRRHLGSFEGVRVAIVGDFLHSRVARSNVHGLLKMGAQVTVCGPRTLLPSVWREGTDVSEGPYSGLLIASTVEQAVTGADVVMALRIQRERQSSGLLPDLREYSRRYGVNAVRLALAKPRALLMHPGPMNEGIEISSEVAHGSQSVIEEQVRNGVAIRMAILYTLCAQSRSIRSDIADV